MSSDAPDDPHAAGPQPNKVYTFNSTELRAIDVAMQPVTPIGGAPLDEIGHEARPVRSAGQRGEAARRQRLGIVYQAQVQRAVPPEQLWEIESGAERQILDLCV